MIQEKVRILRTTVGIAVMIFFMVGVANAEDYTVCDPYSMSAPCNYEFIVDAISGSDTGDTIIVYGGSYFGNLIIDKSLTLRGVDSEGSKPVIEVSSGDAITFNLGSDGSIIKGFDIRANPYGPVPDTGIRVISSGNTINENEVSGFTNGIYISSQSGDNELSFNDIRNNGYGIYIDSGFGNTLFSKQIHLNAIHGIYLVSYNSGDGTDSNHINDNTIDNNDINGIRLDRSQYFEIHNNFIRDNLKGIPFQSASYPSSNNLIYNNYFRNQNNVNFDGTNNNIWSISPPLTVTNIVGGPSIGGNFWATPEGDGYSETCADESPQDGFCDESLNLDISSSNIDSIPLAPVPEASTLTLVTIGFLGLICIGRRKK